MVKYLIFAYSAFLVAQPPGLTLPEAIRQAWKRQPWLLAGEARVDQARAEASAARAGRLPSLQVSANWRRTDEPLQSFATKLDQGRIAAADFDPVRLNAPDPIGGLGASVTLRQPLYAGGRIAAGVATADALASAAVARQSRSRQEVAAAVVQAYFGAEAAVQGVRFCKDALQQARAVEAFVAARTTEGLMLKADLLRAQAFRAQTEADLALARQRESEARNALGLLLGSPAPAELGTPLAEPAPLSGPAASRGDLEAARMEAQAAEAAARFEGGSLKPEISLDLGWGMSRSGFGSAGTAWTNVAVGMRWTFSFAQTRKVQAAHAASRAAEEILRWQRVRADRDRADASAAMEAAEARVRAAGESLIAAEEARRLYGARFESGLLPLTDRLDAETRLAGARALQLSSLVEFRVAASRQALAEGRPVEGVQW